MSADAHQPRHRQALPGDEPVILALMREFYEEEQLVFDESGARRSLQQLLAAPQLGSIFLFETSSSPVGYIVLTYGFSVERHGRYLLVDELYLSGSVRGRGWGTYALELAACAGRQRGVAVMRLEVNHSNRRVRPLYQRNGFHDDKRDLFTRWL